MIVKVGGYEVVLNKKQIAICFAPRKYEIKEAIADLRHTKQLPSNNAGYKPNYEGITTVYAINTARLLKLEYGKRKNKVYFTPAEDANAITTKNNIDNIKTSLPIDIVSNLYINMLKEIILCDYNHVEYNNPKTDDELLSSVAIAKIRKKVILTTKRLSWENGPFEWTGTHYWLNEDRNYSDDPDDDYEERKERRILKERMMEGLRMFMTDPVLAKKFDEQHEIDRQIDELSYVSIKKQLVKLYGQFAEIRLGMKIAVIVASSLYPEFGFTYKELAFQLFPQIRNKNDKEVEPYIQMIVRAIDAVQIYILTRHFRKIPIKIFPIALPLKKDNGIERVFNGYKKKYVDKVLREFITI